jgi:DNA polymerase III epsilon subunit-like protein
MAGLDEAQCYCVSEAYAAFRGEPDRKPERRYRRHKLVEACAAQGIDLDQAHNAAADARATVRLLQALAKVTDDEPVVAPR